MKTKTIEKPPFTASVIELQPSGHLIQVLIAVSNKDAEYLARHLSIVHYLSDFQVFVNGKGGEIYRKGILITQTEFGTKGVIK